MFPSSCTDNTCELNLSTSVQPYDSSELKAEYRVVDMVPLLDGVALGMAMNADRYVFNDGSDVDFEGMAK